MWEFSKVLAEGLEKGDGLVVIALVVVLAVMNFYKLYPLLLERKRHRLKGVEAALQSDCVQGMERACLKEQAATEHFYAATGIMMETAPRQALLRVYDRSDGRVQFVHFKRAASYFSYEKGDFEIKLSHLERLFMWAGLCLGISLFSLSVALLFVTLYMLLMVGGEPLGPWTTWLIFSLTGWAMVMSSRSAYSANRIRKEMARQAKESPPDNPAAAPAPRTPAEDASL